MSERALGHHRPPGLQRAVALPLHGALAACIAAASHTEAVYKISAACRTGSSPVAEAAALCRLEAAGGSRQQQQRCCSGRVTHWQLCQLVHPPPSPPQTYLHFVLAAIAAAVNASSKWCAAA
ncbi:hypothetical protein ABPG75_004389 [Micractinium tetrahymenae]